MKQVILSLLVMHVAIAAIAQTSVKHQSANYEAANWKTWLLDNPQQITVAAAPAAAQSKAELKVIRQAMSGLDEKGLAQIKYWDAGAPSYRWNQILIKVITWDKPDLIL
ncbi:MAG: Phosphoesterase, PA-phosphatase related, partial [Flavisolibacter sp.]|nr:Phosphoesterase, PA-phosphatase related [Flavisolibacter sp.]